MANAFDAITAALESAGSVSNTLNDYLTKQATLSTQTKNIQLQNDINGKLAQIKQDSKFENWNTEINSFFTQIKSGMSNPNSPYYCQNNLQADMFTKILEQNQVSVSDTVNRMVMQEERSKTRIDINKGILNLKNMGLAGQQFYDEAKKLIDGGRAVNAYTQEEYEQMNDTIFYDGYSGMYENMFEETAREAIKRGDSMDKIWNMMQERASAFMKTDGSNMPVAFDKESFDAKIKKGLQARYNAIQQDIWNETEKQCASIYDNILDQRTAEGRNLQRTKGRNYLDSVKDTGLISPDQLTKWTARFALENYYSPEGTTTSSQRKSAASKMDPQDYIDFYMNAIKNGDTTTVYNAWKDFQDDVLDEYRQVTGNYDASIVDVEKAFPKVGKFLEYASNNLPPDFQDVVNYAENVISATLNTKDNKTKYEEEFNSTLDIVKDILFDMDIKNAGPEAKKEIKARVTRAINANLGGVLEKQKDYKEYFGKDYEGIKTLSDYREGVIESKEERMAKAIRERDANPDLVYTKANGVEVPYALQEGLARLENDERSEIKELIKSRTGKDISDGDIKMSYESDGRNDITARRRYTIDGVDYRFRTEDGKHIILEKKKNGERGGDESNDNTGWETVKTVSQQKEYDSPKAVTKRTEAEVTSIVKKTNWNKTNIPAGGFTYTDENGKQQKLTYIDPEGDEKVINQTYWKHLRPNEQKRIIMDWMEKEPEAAKAWLDKLEAK